MKWLGATAGLLAASVCLVAWIYLRDRETSSWRPPERQLAHWYAGTVLAAYDGPRCHRGCTIKLLAHHQPNHWLARITVRHEARCFEIDLATFALTPQHGLTGVEPVSCVNQRR